MGVVRVGHMRMRMPQRLVPVPVAVLADGHHVVQVPVVPVVVAVRVLVLQRLVRSCAARGHVTPPGAAPRRPASAALPSSIRPLAERSPSATANAAPMKGAKANTEPVRAAPKARCASR
jgi:hypothetical protein